MPLTFSTRAGNLNWLFLVEVIVVVVVVLFYLFYFGRLFAYILTLILRPFLWRKYRVSLEIGSIQFSPLGGRFLFRDVIYVGENETVKVTVGHITWRYWLWRVRQEEDLRKENTKHPCRTTVELDGLEWFIYNRSPAYDILLERLGHREKGKRQGEGAGHKSGNEQSDTTSDRTDAGSMRMVPPPREVRSLQDNSDIDWFREALPVEIHATRGAIVLGNRSTPSLLIAGFRDALGTCGTVTSRSKYDFYKQVYQFTFDRPKIVFRKNHDYEGPMTEHGSRMDDTKKKHFGIDPRPTSETLSFTYFQDLLRRLTSLADAVYEGNPFKSPVNQAETWHGLARYRAAAGALYGDEGNTAGGLLHNEQYAKASTIYDNGDSLELTYYADMAGYVPDLSDLEKRKLPALAGFEKPDIGNGDLAPEWGIDLRLNGGVLTYGPWADRQRGEIQKTFFPPAYFSSEATPHLRPGDRRVHAALKVYVELAQSTVFRLPTREASKDWKYDGMTDTDSVIDVTNRSYGWLDVQIGPHSSVNLVLPMLADHNGYDTMLEVHLDDLSIVSSVNYERFFTARLCRVSCLLPAPLIWDDLRTWTINVNLEQPEVFFLRDHAYLLTDIVRDWTSGPPVKMEYFVPFLYKLNLNLSDFGLYLYLNERNIVNNAADQSDNTLLLLAGQRVKACIDIPSAAYRAPFSTLSVDLDTDRVDLSMLPPAWNTHNGFRTSNTRTVGRLERLQLALKHTVYAVSHPDNVESLDIVVNIDGIMFIMLGWVIKYLVIVKENYFGDHSHFVTLEEFRYRHGRQEPGDPLEKKYRPGQSDIFEVTLDVTAKRSIALLPQELYDCHSALALDIPEFGVHLRNHDYFMELAADVDPVEMSLVSDCAPVILSGQLPPAGDTNKLLLDGLSITSHRLFGPQPRTSVYVAIWEFHLGKLVGDITIPHISALQRVAQTFAVNFKDVDNALPPAYGTQTDLDVTFLSFTMEGLDITVWSHQSAVNILAPLGVAFKFDDQAGEGWLSHMDADIPHIEVRGLVPVDQGHEEYVEVVGIAGGLSLGVAKTRKNWQTIEHGQKRFLKTQDILTRRCAFLYAGEKESGYNNQAMPLYLPVLHPGEVIGSQHIDPPPISKSSTRRRRESLQRNIEIARSRKTTTTSTDSGLATYDALLRQFSRPRTSNVYSYLDSPAFIANEPLDSALNEANTARNASAKSRVRGVQALYQPRYADETLHRVDLDFYTPIKAACSPASVRVAEDIIATLEKNDHTEHWLDASELVYRKQTNSQHDAQPLQAAHFTASLSSITLKLVQDVLRPGDLDMLEQLDTEISRESAILSMSLLTVKAIEVSYLNKKTMLESDEGTLSITSEQKLHFSSGRARLHIRHSQPSTNGHTLHEPITGLPQGSPGTVLDMLLQGLSADASISTEVRMFAATIGDNTLNFVTSAAELVTGTVHSWFIVSRAIEQAVLKAQYRILPRYRRLVTDILQYAHQQQITTDPTFLNRAPLIPLQGRDSLSWRLLAHTRHCLRHISLGARQQLSNDLLEEPVSSSEEDFRTFLPLIREWYGWDLEITAVKSLAIVQYLFPLQAQVVSSPGDRDVPKAKQPAPAWSWNAPFQASLHLGKQQAFYFEDAMWLNRLELQPTDILVAYSGTDGKATQALQPAILARVHFGALTSELGPTLIRLVRHVGRVRSTYGRKLAPLIPRPQAADFQPKSYEAPPPLPAEYLMPASLPVSLSLVVQSIEVTTRTNGVRASTSLNLIHGTLSTKVQSTAVDTTVALDGQAFLGCDSIRILAATESTASATRDHIGSSTLFVIQVQDVHAFAELVSLGQARPTLDVAGTASSCRIRVPRSILRISQFIEQWQSDALPQSKIAFEELRKDLEASRAPVPTAKPPSDRPLVEIPKDLIVKGNLLIPLINLHVRPAHKFWLDYTVGDILLTGVTSLTVGAERHVEAGLRIGEQSVSFIAVSEAQQQGQRTPFNGEVIRLPALHGQLEYEKQDVNIVASLGYIDVALTADILDSVLTVQARFEHDIDELLSVLANRKSRKSGSREPAAKAFTSTEETNISWRARVALRGLNLGLKGPRSIQYIGADLVEGFISTRDKQEGHSPIAWQVNALNLGVSLAQRYPSTTTNHSTATGANPTLFDRDYRLAYFILDVQAGNRVSEVSELPAIADNQDASHLHIRLPKVHAVMQTAAIEALDELIEHFLTEIKRKREERASELSAIKAKVIQTFDIQEKQTAPQVLPWIERCVLSLRLGSLGIAIPLADDEIDAPRSGQISMPDKHARPAFLLSTPSLVFATAKGTAGFAKMNSLSGQFVDSFDQGNPQHFTGLYHNTQNRILFPSAEVTLASDEANASRMKAFTVQARMSGAELDIDYTIIASVFALMDLYERGYERLARHAPDPAVLKPTQSAAEGNPEPYSLLNTTTFEASFVVDSGIINMHNTLLSKKQDSTEPVTSSNKHRRPTPVRSNTIQGGTLGPTARRSRAEGTATLAPDSFVIPKFSMWAAKREASQQGQEDGVHLDAIIHSSRNTLYPSLLPFLSNVSDSIKDRMQRQPPLASALATPAANNDKESFSELTQVATDTITADPTLHSSSLRSLRITFSLRIDRSRLEISCLQAAQVAAVLNWQSGGVIFSMHPGRRTAEVALRVEEIGFELRHSYAPEKCLGGSARSLALALSFGPRDETQTLLSANFDATSITGDINFRQLQDFLCFKAVWLDRLEQLVPVPANASIPPEKVPDASQNTHTSTLVTIIVARIQEVRLTCMLGQSIGTVDLQASHLVGRLRLIPKESRAFSVDLRNLKASAKGRLTGSFNADGLYFENSYHDLRSPAAPSLINFVKLSARIGAMNAGLEFDYRKVLLVQSDPIHIGATDDWRSVHDDRKLRLQFFLRFGSFSVIATTQTVPTLVRLGNDLEKLMEDRSLKARTALFGSDKILPPVRPSVPKPELLSPSAWQIKPICPTGIPEGVQVISTIHLEAARLRFAVFLHHFSDVEAFRADAGAVRAQLERGLGADDKLARDLNLHLGFFNIRKLRPKKVGASQERDFTLQDWFDLLRAASERNIVRIPTSEAKMVSTQETGSNKLYHHFSLLFTGQVDISLNFALLKQLGELANAYKEGMARTRQTDNRTAPSTPFDDATLGNAKKGAGTSDKDSSDKEQEPAKKVVAGNLPPPAAVDILHSLEYIALENNIQQPQLQLLGDATPPLEWLGVQRGHFPGWIHEGVTTVLEHILLELSEVYKKCLAHNASSSAAG